MNNLVKYLVTGTILLGFSVSQGAVADDNIADCEIVVQKKLDPSEIGDKSPVLASFMPAAKFIFSVFDSEPGFIKEVNGNPIRAIMCTRSSVIPTEFDLKIIRTDIPFYLSTDFDKQDSPFLAIAKKDGKYVYDYAGPDLSRDDRAALALMMKKLGEMK
ncbi:MAG TPA: hypothetical protein ENK01_01100 [Hellea balneolensis]|uniref:DUF302 domain-containing protein n=1 Tax=Hellea balneolensis TaxID=287478 RepID=A0A7V5NWE9_9PROT|nr:hypothetical protein [Hellea balneolensis]